MVDHGYIDTFRQYNKEPNQFTWWDLKTGARARNVGWRIDYFFVNKEFLPQVKNAFILQQVTGSDHCPVGIEIIIYGDDLDRAASFVQLGDSRRLRLSLKDDQEYQRQ